MNIVMEKNGEETIVKVSGRVDTVTTQELQEEVMKAFMDTNAVELDFEEVEYISSAGLRTLLLGHKTAVSKGGYMKITHVKNMVFDVLKITGLSSVLNVSQ